MKILLLTYYLLGARCTPTPTLSLSATFFPPSLPPLFFFPSFFLRPVGRSVGRSSSSAPSRTHISLSLSFLFSLFLHPPFALTSPSTALHRPPPFDQTSLPFQARAFSLAPSPPFCPDKNFHLTSNTGIG